MKAIIEVSRRGSAIQAARQQIAAARQGRPPDFRLSFESARSLFAELTPARLGLTPKDFQSCLVLFTQPQCPCLGDGLKGSAHRGFNALGRNGDGPGRWKRLESIQINVKVRLWHAFNAMQFSQTLQSYRDPDR